MTDQLPVVAGLRVRWGARVGTLIWVSDSGVWASFLEAGAEDIGPPTIVRIVDLDVPDIDDLEVPCPKCHARAGAACRRVGTSKPSEVEPHAERQAGRRVEQARQDKLREKGKKK